MGEETTRLRDEIDRTRQDLARDVNRLSDKTSPSQIMERRVQRTRGGLVSLKEKVMGSDARQTTKDAVSHAGERTSDAAHDSVTTVREQTEGNPLAAGLVAFGAGWLVSSLLPVSEAETQAAQRVGEVAREHGGPVLDQAKQSVTEVAQDLKGHAQDAAAQVKDAAQQAAAEVKDTTQEHAQATRDEVRAAVPG